MSKQPRLHKLLWHKLERFGFVGAFLFMVLCLFFSVVFACFGLVKLAGACMMLAGVALLTVLFVFIEKEKK